MSERVIRQEDKASLHHVDTTAPDYQKDGLDRHLAVEMPASLVGLSEEEMAVMDKSMTKKVDLLLMPVLITLYILNYLDRQNISSAKLANITGDLGLTANDYSTAVAVLFAGYVAFQIPSNMLASKIKYPGIYICFMCAAWGLVSGCTGAVHNFPGLAVCRVILGFTESAFFPGALFLVSLFYRKEQIALRMAILYVGSQLGNAFGGLFALAILELDGVHGVAGWRWLFIVEGALTVGIAIIFATFIPNRPENVRWLTPLERDLLLYRLEQDRGTKDATDEVSAWQGFIMAVSDPKTWMLCAVLYANYVAASVTNFFPIVVNGLGFSRTVTLAITAPPYLLCCVAIVVNGWHSDKKQERTLHIIIPLCITIIGNVIAISTTKVAPRYVAMCLLPASFYSASTVVLSWISGVTVGPSTKRASVYALINAICNTPNIWTSYLYGNNGPRYILAFSVDLATAALAIVLAALTYLYLRRQNAKLDRGEDMGKNGPSTVQVEAGFRYIL